MTLTAKELATMLHGLRMIQEVASGDHCCYAGMCEHFDDVEEMTDSEIDALCEKLNGANIGDECECGRPKHLCATFEDQAAMHGDL